MLKPITIVGGGLAGLALGIGLRRSAIPVAIWEAAEYPRRKVCGEFISGQGQDVLRKLDLVELLLAAGAARATTACLCGQRAASPSRPLPQPALCLTRFVMDAVLARRFQELGGELLTHTRWEGESQAEGLVLANGRRKTRSGQQWFGLSVHALNVALGADLELHAFADGYVGLCRLKGGVTNICGVFRRPRRAKSADKANIHRLLLGERGSLLRERLAGAVIDQPTRRSVAGLCLKPQRASGARECRIGDALTMIPPATGNGMSMALEAAEMAISPLAAYSRGQLSWTAARAHIARSCDIRFASRLKWAKWLHWMMTCPPFQSCLGAPALGSDWLWRKLFARTR